MVVAGALSLAVVLFAFIRAIVWLTYGHDYGVAAFVEECVLAHLEAEAHAFTVGACTPLAGRDCKVFPELVGDGYARGPSREATAARSWQYQLFELSRSALTNVRANVLA